MAATPKYGVLIARGIKTGKTYSVDMYFSDVANENVKFDSGAGASSTSPEFKVFPEPVVIEDIAIQDGMQDTTKIRLVVNGTPQPDVFRYSVHLESLNNRPKLNIGIKEGSMLSFLQLA